MRAERVGADTLLSRIVQMVSEAQRSRAPIQRLADVVASYFVPAVLAISALTFVVWAVFGPEPRLAHALVNAVAVLIIACPCALGLATPMSIMVGTGRGAQAGVLIRNAEALEVLERIDTLVVDKTGTLTEGKPRLVAVETEGIDAARAARPRRQPRARQRASARGGDRRRRAGAWRDARRGDRLLVTHRPGRARPRRRDTTSRSATTACSPRWASTPARWRNAPASWRRQGQTAMYAAVDGRVAGLIGVADPIKASTQAAVQLLHDDGVRLVMLTGDTRATAETVARELGIDEVEAEVLPDQKAAAIARLRGEGRRVAMAGDGVNDAPALAAADVGIAMGTGTDVAIESAGVTLVKGDLRGIAKARRLSRATMRNIRQNLFFAFLYNSLGVPIAAGALYPFFGLLLSPMLAAAAMTFSSVSVITNALRLRRLEL